MEPLRLVVCVKSVSDPRLPAESTIDPSTGIVRRRADEMGAPRVISPLDRFALEEALRIKEDHGGTTVTALSMDTSAAREALRESIALGCDQAILLSDASLAGADTLATARCLAAAIRQLGAVDLILCGAWSYHGNTGQVGPQLAEVLGIAHISFATHLEFAEPRTVRVRSEWEGQYALVEAGLPLLITVCGSGHPSRHASLMGITRARGVQVIQWGRQDLALSPDVVGLAGSPSRVTGVSVVKSFRRQEILDGDTQVAVRLLVERLRDDAVL